MNELRDYFAAEAMQALLANPEALQEMAFQPPDFKKTANVVAKCAYVAADAMIEERNKKANKS